MRIAILTDTDEAFVEFPEPVFRQLLRELLPKYNNDVDLAMDTIIKQLKQLTSTK